MLNFTIRLNQRIGKLSYQWASCRCIATRSQSWVERLGITDLVSVFRNEHWNLGSKSWSISWNPFLCTVYIGTVPDKKTTTVTTINCFLTLAVPASSVCPTYQSLGHETSGHVSYQKIWEYRNSTCNQGSNQAYVFKFICIFYSWEVQQYNS